MTIGSEGFFGPGDPNNKYNPNPGQSWPLETGQNFSYASALPGIDYAEIHMWVDDWKEVRHFPARGLTPDPWLVRESFILIL